MLLRGDSDGSFDFRHEEEEFGANSRKGESGGGMLVMERNKNKNYKVNCCRVSCTCFSHLLRILV